MMDSNLVRRSGRNRIGRASEGVPTVPWICDAAAYGRIIKAVGEQYPCTNRDRLVSDLYSARSRLLTAVALDSDKGARSRKALFSAIVESAEIFKERLLNDCGDRYAARNIFFGVSQCDAFLDELNRVIDRAKDLQRQNSRGGWVRLSRSPKEWFAGEVLPQVFECNFGRKAAASTNSMTNKVSGPFIKFAVAVMREMGIQISPETVGRVLKDVHKGRARRRSRPTTLARPLGW
jgi:hypothetical protein